MCKSNFALPITTSVTISIPISQIFQSCVATSHLRPPMAFFTSQRIRQYMFHLWFLILSAMRLSNKLLGQGYINERLKSSLRKFIVL